MNASSGNYEYYQKKSTYQLDVSPSGEHECLYES